MRRRWAIVVSVAGLVLMAGAMPAAAREKAPLCGNYPPIGQPLPRQDTAQRASKLLDKLQGPGKRWIGQTRIGEPVTVLEECGLQRRIRTPDGIEGWVGLTTLPHENQLQVEARNRPHEAEYDCELQHYNDRTTAAIDACKAALPQKPQ